MATITGTSRTAHLLALMKQGDDAFNDRDFAVLNAIHHPGMIAYVTGNAEPIYGAAAHAAMVRQMFRSYLPGRMLPMLAAPVSSHPLFDPR